MALEKTVMTHLEPRDLGRPVRLHGLYALMLAACIAIGAIAAALALLDNAARPSGARAASPAANSTFASGGDSARNERAVHRSASTGRTERR
jgi:hypothetical protein